MTAFQGKAANHRRLRAMLLALGMACVLSVPVRAEQAGSFWIRSAHTVLINAVYHLDARIDFHLSSAALEALHNGVPLTIDIHMQVVRNRDWLWSQVVADLHQRYRLQYHALSERYLVKNLNTGVVSSHQALQDALESMGIIHNFPMLDEHLLTPGYRYVGRLQASLDIEALPTPMRVWAYVTPQWHLSTDWYTWPLKG